jgi:hypothetical protein
MNPAETSAEEVHVLAKPNPSKAFFASGDLKSPRPKTVTDADRSRFRKARRSTPATNCNREEIKKIIRRAHSKVDTECPYAKKPSHLNDTFA